MKARETRIRLPLACAFIPTNGTICSERFWGDLA